MLLDYLYLLKMDDEPPKKQAQLSQFMGLEMDVYRKLKRLKETVFEVFPTFKRVIDNVKVMRRSNCPAPITSGAAAGSEEK